MAIKALNLMNSKDVTHPEDKDNPTVWSLAALDSRTTGFLADKNTVFTANAEGEQDVKISANDLMFMTVQFGLRGFVNFIDHEGNEVQFKTETKVVGNKSYDVCSSEIVALIPVDVVRWLAEQISNFNSVEEGEKKS